MLKRWAIFGMLLVVFCANSRTDQVEAKNNEQQPPAPVSFVSQQQPNAEPPQGEDQKDIHADVKIVNPPEKDFYDKAPVWTNLVLVIVALGTGIVIGWQAWETRKSAKASLAQIHLMKEQSHRMMEKERARLKVQGGRFSVEGEPPGKWILAADLEIANHGPSKAYITRKRGNLAIVKNGESLPELDESFGMLLPYPFDIINTEADPICTVFYFEDTPYSLRELFAELVESRLVMYLYGFIEYETMGEGWHLPFKYRWQMPEIPIGMSERSLAEDINILGGWEDPCSQENEEHRVSPN